MIPLVQGYKRSWNDWVHVLQITVHFSRDKLRASMIQKLKFCFFFPYFIFVDFIILLYFLNCC